MQRHSVGDQDRQQGPGPNISSLAAVGVLIAGMLPHGVSLPQCVGTAAEAGSKHQASGVKMQSWRSHPRVCARWWVSRLTSFTCIVTEPGLIAI